MLTKEQKLSLFKETFDYFETDEIKEWFKDVIAEIPDITLISPSSTSLKFHNATQCQVFGNTLHLLMVGKICHYLLGLEHMQNKFPKPKQRDCILAASYLHDAMKLGKNNSPFTLFKHPLLVGEWIKEMKVDHDIKDGLKDYISSLCASHSGQWNTSNRDKTILPKPETFEQEFIHVCDYLGSRSDIDMIYSDEFKKTISNILKEMSETEVITFGKYKGETVKSVYTNHKDYFEWLEDNGGIKEPMRSIIKSLNK